MAKLWLRDLHGFNLSDITESEFKSLFLTYTPLIDVRAPVEFAIGSLPNAVNIPIMDDAQRAAVGTTYKKQGREEAIRLGHELVSGKVKEARLHAWAQHVRKHPQTVLYCFRGGLRSKITRQWLSEIGMNLPLIEGGYKSARQFLRQTVDRYSERPFYILSGPTGSAKTHVLNQAASFYPTLDLESLARHRGSAFGSMEEPQPSQINFENAIAMDFLRLDPEENISNILLEDESRLIGRCAIPEKLFTQMRASGVLYLEESFEQRVENIFQDYVVQYDIGPLNHEKLMAQFAKFKNAIKMISRKLGGARTQEILQEIMHSENEYLQHRGLESNRAWIAKLLRYYYDPAYGQSFEKRNPRVFVRGRSDVVLDFIRAGKPV